MRQGRKGVTILARIEATRGQGPPIPHQSGHAGMGRRIGVLQPRRQGPAQSHAMSEFPSHLVETRH